MSHPGTTLYVPLGPDLEIRITLQARQYNGIASDPRTIVRDCSVTEALRALKAIADRREVHTAPTLDYPTACAGDLADAIATEILTPHALPECTRLQLMSKQPDGSERNMGGYNKAGLVSLLRGMLP